MNKVNPTSCVATSNQNINIPDDQGRNIVLYFYPKDDTPGCTIEGNDFTRLNDSFAENNSVIYAFREILLHPMKNSSKNLITLSI